MDARTWSLALNTLLLAGATCAISLPLGSALAWLLVRTDLPGRRIFGLLHSSVEDQVAGICLAMLAIFAAAAALAAWSAARWTRRQRDRSSV